MEVEQQQQQQQTHDNNKGPINKSATIYHLPATIFFKDFENNKWVKTRLKDIIGNVTRNIARYGYGVNLYFTLKILQNLSMQQHLVIQ